MLRIGLALWIALLAAPAGAEIVNVVCPDGVAYVGDLSRCPCCEDMKEANRERLREERAQKEADRDAATVVVWAFLAIAAVVYFIPYGVARRRRHPNIQAIAALNLLLGWTFLGWAIALIWALTGPRPDGRSG